jgi:hypothetical protein
VDCRESRPSQAESYVPDPAILEIVRAMARQAAREEYERQRGESSVGTDRVVSNATLMKI